MYASVTVCESRFRSVCIVSGSGEVVCAFGGREGVDGGTDGAGQIVDGACSGFAQEYFQLGEGVFDRIEIGRVRRKEEQPAAPRRRRA